MTTPIENFRLAFLKCALNPSFRNKARLRNTSIRLYELAEEEVKKSFENPGADELNDKIIPLIDEALTHLRISQKQYDALEKYLDALPREDVLTSTVLTGALSKLQEKLATHEHYSIFASIYSIELDGQRLKHIPAGQAALTLSKKLLAITDEVMQQGGILKDIDKKRYKEAYEAAKNQGIETHRGMKQKFYNFLTLVSCILIFPIGYYAHRGHFWPIVKTKTQEDIDLSRAVILAER